jgi:hypothetical protein
LGISPSRFSDSPLVSIEVPTIGSVDGRRGNRAGLCAPVDLRIAPVWRRRSDRARYSSPAMVFFSTRGAIRVPIWRRRQAGCGRIPRVGCAVSLRTRDQTCPGVGHALRVRDAIGPFPARFTDPDATGQVNSSLFVGCLRAMRSQASIHASAISPDVSAPLILNFHRNAPTGGLRIGSPRFPAYSVAGLAIGASSRARFRVDSVWFDSHPFSGASRSLSALVEHRVGSCRLRGVVRNSRAPGFL